MENLIVIVASIIIIPSGIIFFELTKYMIREIKNPADINVGLLVLTGLWIFSKSHFNENLDGRFLAARICMLLIGASAYTIYKFYD